MDMSLIKWGYNNENEAITGEGIGARSMEMRQNEIGSEVQ